MAPRPRRSPARYGIVGDGRLARHICRYFSLLSIPHRRWSRRSGADLERTLAGCPVLLLLISDDALAGFVAAHPAAPGQVLVHCSGALSVPGAQGFHPLMSFGSRLLSLEEYRAVPFISESGARPFPEVFPELGNPHHTIPAGSRAFYHSLAVLSGNFSVMLWQKLFREFRDTLRLPQAAALPYLRQVFRSLERDPAAALTGPVQRGDAGTVSRNLQALAGDPFARVYESFVLAAQEERG